MMMPCDLLEKKYTRGGLAIFTFDEFGCFFLIFFYRFGPSEEVAIVLFRNT